MTPCDYLRPKPARQPLPSQSSHIEHPASPPPPSFPATAPTPPCHLVSSAIFSTPPSPRGGRTHSRSEWEDPPPLCRWRRGRPCPPTLPFPPPTPIRRGGEGPAEGGREGGEAASAAGTPAHRPVEGRDTRLKTAEGVPCVAGGGRGPRTSAPLAPAWRGGRAGRPLACPSVSTGRSSALALEDRPVVGTCSGPEDRH